jgi:spermidine synthase
LASAEVEPQREAVGRTGAFFVAISVVFFLSGITGLTYEVAWVRLFAGVLGSSNYAVSAVLTSFMAGLALGSYVIGKSIDRRGNPLLIYAVLELGIGLSAVAIPFLLSLMDNFYALLFPYIESSPWALMAIKIVVSFLILIVPTFLMGGTLPVLARFFVRRVEERGTRVAVLYAVNTLGATVGCFVTGFILIEMLGVRRTIQVTALANVLLSIPFFALGLRKQGRPENKQTAPVEEPEAALPASGKVRFLLLAVMLAGFVALSFEVVWTRLLIFKLNTTTYAFSLMLTTFLAGIGLGSAIYGGLERLKWVRNPTRLFGVLELAIGLLGLLSIVLFGQFEVLLKNWGASSWGEKVAQKMFLAALIMLLPATLMGMTFPLVTRMCLSSVRRVGSSIGQVYALNTLGSILGSLLTGFFLVLTFGTQRTILITSLLALALGSMILWYREDSNSRREVSLAFALPVTGLAWLLAFVLYAPIPKDFLFQYYNITEKGVDSRVKILHAYEGVECVTTVHRYPNGDRVISTGSMNVAGTAFTLRTTQMLQAHIPMLLHPAPKDVLQVGFGSGETSHILTSYDTENVDIVEISRGVIRTSAEFFADINENVVDHPKWEAIIMDGSNYVSMTHRKYDVIMNDSIWPYYSGNSNLYTREYFEAGRKHLKPGGFMTSWFPLVMPEESLKTLLQTFHAAFPHVSLWFAVTHENQHALILGSDRELSIDVESFLQRFDQFAREDMELIALGDPLVLLDCFKVDETAFADWVKDSPMHTRDLPILEFAPRIQDPTVLEELAYDLFTKHRSSVVPYLKYPPGLKFGDRKLLDALKTLEQATQLVMTGFVMREKSQPGFEQRFHQALELWPDHPGALYFLQQAEGLRSAPMADVENLQGRNYRDLMAMGDNLMKNGAFDKAIVVFRQAVQADPESADALTSLGVAMARRGNLPGAIQEFQKAIQLDGDHGKALNNLGLAMMNMQRLAEALPYYQRAVKADPDYADARTNFGIALMRVGRGQEAMRQFSEALTIQPAHAGAHNNLGIAMATLNNLDKAMEHYRQALRIDPNYVQAFFNLGHVLEKKGQVPEAITQFQEGLKLDPNNADAHDDLGRMLQSQGRQAEAKRHLAEAKRLRSQMPSRPGQ